MKDFFIAGTGTGVGKTFITGNLLKVLRKSGCNCISQKWIQTGSDEEMPGDIELHSRLAGIDMSEYNIHLDILMPYKFKHPSSPHLASSLEGERIDINKIRDAYNSAALKWDTVIIEGSGGLMVPLNTKDLLLDQVRSLDLPVVLVSNNVLGTINHTLLSINVMQRYGIRILGIIFNQAFRQEDSLIIDDNPMIIETFSGIEILGSIGHYGCRDQHDQVFADIAGRILNKV